MRIPRSPDRAPRVAARHARAAWVVAGATALAVVLGGCAGPDSLTTLEPPAAPRSEAEDRAEQLEAVIENLELRYAVADPASPAGFLGPYVPAEKAAAVLAEHVTLGSQPRAYVSAHAAYLDDEWSGTERPRSVDVAIDEVSVVGALSQAPVARVQVVTTYAFDDAPSTSVSAEYAISWSAGADESRLDGVYPLYDDGGRPALDSGEGGGSPSGAVHDYLWAVTHGSSRDVDDLEGHVHTSEDLREELKTQLVASPRYIPVEIPPARSGTTHVLYYVPASGAQAVRFEVTVDGDGPRVVPHL